MPRFANRWTTGRRALLPEPPPGTEPRRTAVDLLLRSWPGRLFIVSTLLKFLVALIRRIGEPPTFVLAIGTAATLGLLVALGYFLIQLFLLMKRRLLWRVRRKLILSYIFIGVVPALLIVGFFLLSAVVLSMNISAYLFRDGYDDIVTFARVAAEGAASEIARMPERTPDTVARFQRNSSRLYRGLSMAFIPAGERVPPVRAGEWDHLTELPPIPEWLMLRADGFAGTTVIPAHEAQDEVALVVRAAVPA